MFDRSASMLEPPNEELSNKRCRFKSRYELATCMLELFIEEHEDLYDEIDIWFFPYPCTVARTNKQADAQLRTVMHEECTYTGRVYGDEDQIQYSPWRQKHSKLKQSRPFELIRSLAPKPGLAYSPLIDTIDAIGDHYRAQPDVYNFKIDLLILTDGKECANKIALDKKQCSEHFLMDKKGHLDETSIWDRKLFGVRPDYRDKSEASTESTRIRTGWEWARNHINVLAVRIDHAKPGKGGTIPVPVPTGALTRKRVHTLLENGRSLTVALGDENSWFCSGVLIASDWVLTAAHCLPVTRVGTGESVQSIDAEYKVVSSIKHPDSQVDAALVRLESNIPDVVHLSLFSPSPDSDGPALSAVQIGYGADTLLRERPLDLGEKKHRVFPIEGWQCDRSSAHAYGCHIGKELVAAANDGRDTCLGDSGSPLLAFDELPDGQCVPRILAVTSRSLPSHKILCGAGGIYVRADALKYWVDKHIVTHNPHKETTP